MDAWRWRIYLSQEWAPLLIVQCRAWSHLYITKNWFSRLYLYTCAYTYVYMYVYSFCQPLTPGSSDQMGFLQHSTCLHFFPWAHKGKICLLLRPLKTKSVRSPGQNLMSPQTSEQDLYLLWPLRIEPWLLAQIPQDKASQILPPTIRIRERPLPQLLDCLARAAEEVLTAC